MYCILMLGIWLHPLTTSTNVRVWSSGRKLLKSSYTQLNFKDVANVPVLGLEILALQYRHWWYNWHSARYRYPQIHEISKIEPTSSEVMQSPVESQPTEPPGATTAEPVFSQSYRVTAMTSLFLVHFRMANSVTIDFVEPTLRFFTN